MKSIAIPTDLVRHSFRACLAVTLVVVTWLALADTSDVPSPWYSDKVNHVAAFFVLAFLAANSFPQRHAAWLLGGLLAYGLGLELAQTLTPTRSFELLDLAADAAGIMAYLPLRRWTGDLAGAQTKQGT